MIYQKKPVRVQALQWRPASPNEVKNITKWFIINDVNVMFEADDTLSLPTLEGTMTAQPGDWVIRGVQGEFYPCKPDIFEATYERVRGAI